MLVEKKVIYRQRNNCKNRHHVVGSALTYLKKEIRNSIIPKNVKDIDSGKLSSCNIITFM